MTRFWRWLAGPSWRYDKGGRHFALRRTDPATGAAQVWFDGGWIPEIR